MKRFEIKPSGSSFNENTKEYSVWFGNHRGVAFYSKRYMHAFIAKTNQWMTAIMVEISLYYVMAFAEYRNTWFILYNSKTGKRVNHFDIERRIQSCIRDIEDQFNRAGNSPIGSDTGGWAFFHLMNVCLFLADLLKELIAVNKARNNTIQYQNMQQVHTNVVRLAELLRTYPQELPENAVRIMEN